MAIEKHMLQTHSLFEKAGEVFEGVAKLKERIADLEAERDSFEKSFNEMTEAFIKSQRALWLARAERARVESIYWINLMYEEKWIAVKFTVKRKHGENIKPGQTTRTPEKWFNIWDVVVLYCKQKAKECK